MENYFRDGIMGLVTGDALGVPVEFADRKKLKTDPVTDMRAYGTHYQPAGTWSDDSSMVLAEMDSLLKGLDYQDMMEKFSLWWMYGDYTPYGKAFDIGISTSRAIMNYGKGMEPLDCGGKAEMDNGNGSLMRILPVALYVYKETGNLCRDESLTIIHQASRLTHAHPRSQIACGIYAILTEDIIRNKKEETPADLCIGSLKRSRRHYEETEYPAEWKEELEEFGRLWDGDAFFKMPEEKIESTGYVVDTLEAAVWCFGTTESYRDCVLKAVNLGNDTDTVAAVAGGLAGCYYGYEAIPEEWRRQLARREWIEELCRELFEK